MMWLFIIYFLLFIFLSWKNFKFALSLFVFVLPFSYLIRFDFFGLPSTLLELSFGAIFLVWIVKYFKNKFNIRDYLQTSFHAFNKSSLSLSTEYLFTFSLYTGRSIFNDFNIPSTNNPSS